MDSLAPEERVALTLARKALEHLRPEQCWATGPATGDPIEDLVVCPGCRAINAIDAVTAEPAQPSKGADRLIAAAPLAGLLVTLHDKVTELESRWSNCSAACARLQDERDQVRRVLDRTSRCLTSIHELCEDNVRNVPYLCVILDEIARLSDDDIIKDATGNIAQECKALGCQRSVAHDLIQELRSEQADAIASLRHLVEANDDYLSGDTGFPFADALDRAKAFLRDKQP